MIDTKMDLPSIPLKLNFDNKFKLSLNDSVLIYKTDSLLNSNFRTFSFHLESGKSYKVSIFSLCDCIGFKKYMFVPELLFTDTSNNKMDVDLVKQTIDYFSAFQPISFIKEWEIKNPRINDIKIVVYSENSKLQQTIEKVLATGYAYTPGVFLPIVVPVSLKSSLVGDFIIRIDELK